MSTKTYFPAYDGNGNLSALLGSAGGSLDAKYELNSAERSFSRNLQRTWLPLTIPTIQRRVPPPPCAVLFAN